MQATTQANITIQELDESTIDSYEISIDEITDAVVSCTPKTMAPSPISLRIPPCPDGGTSLGVELSLSLPIIVYIHPTSPLLNVLHVGDVILELDGRRSTEMGFEELNGWFAGRSFCASVDGVIESRERSILFLPGRNNPYNPECDGYDPDGLKNQSSVVELPNCRLELVSPMKNFSRKETNTTESSESDAASTASSDTEQSPMKLNTTGEMTESSESDGMSAATGKDQVESGGSVAEDCSSILSSGSTSECTLYLDDGASDSLTLDCMAQECSGTDIECASKPVGSSSISEKDEGKEVPISPSTAATTVSKSSTDVESSLSGSLDERSNNHDDKCSSDIPADFIAPDLESPDESSISVDHPSSPLVPERPSPQHAASSSEELNEVDLKMLPQPLTTECKADDVKQSTNECGDASSGSDSASDNIRSQNEFDELCQSVLKKNGVTDDVILESIDPSTVDQTQEVDKAELVIHSEQTALIENECTEDKEPIIDISTPLITPVQTPPEEDNDLHHKGHNRPKPTFDTITIDFGCDEDISTIFGGKFIPSAHASNARVEDKSGCVESGNYDPNTLSQLKLHGLLLDDQIRIQRESQARKLALEEQDYQMKKERLNLLKKKHCIIEGIFAVFICVAAVVLVGVLVVLLHNNA